MSQSSPWSLVWKMLGIVLLTYLMANMIFLIVYGLWEQDFMLTIGSTFCSFPLVFLFVWLRRPKLKHILSAFPVEGGQTIHPITDNRVLHTSVPTRFAHHLIRDSPPVELPPARTLWTIFFVTVFVSIGAFLPVLITDHPLAILLVILVAIPAWLVGFSVPVHAWWSFSMHHLDIQTTKWQAEMMLIAGMLSTIPAIVINSILSPSLLNLAGLSAFDANSVGEFLLLTMSAPIGEEICKGFLILSLYRIIDSPKRGFQVGFCVGLGFAMLENLQYILGSLFGGEYLAFSYGLTTIIRGIGSIPGHAVWSGLTGCAIGWQISKKRKWTTAEANLQETNWVLIEPDTGIPIQQQTMIQQPKDIVKPWLQIPQEKAWKLPESPVIALGLAILGHALWNGSSWGVGYLTRDLSPGIGLLALISWTGFLIGCLWFVGRQIMASVQYLPNESILRNPLVDTDLSQKELQ